MPINVFLSTTLRDLVPGYNPVEGLTLTPKGEVTAAGLAEEIGLPPAEIKIVMLNGRRSELSVRVVDGDRVGFFPAVGGG